MSSLDASPLPDVRSIEVTFGQPLRTAWCCSQCWDKTEIVIFVIFLIPYLDSKHLSKIVIHFELWSWNKSRLLPDSENPIDVITKTLIIISTDSHHIFKFKKTNMSIALLVKLSILTKLLNRRIVKAEGAITYASRVAVLVMQMSLMIRAFLLS